MNTRELILVDTNDQPTGTAGKMEAHRKGLLHRAFSVFIFNAKGEMLLQQRAKDKYHSPGLWTNACCSHPFPGEDTREAAGRRLQEELGFNTPLQENFSFIYKADFENGLTEHEFDHVFTGIYDGAINANQMEVQQYKFTPLEEILSDVEDNPGNYTVWFKLALPALLNNLPQYVPYKKRSSDRMA